MKWMKTVSMALTVFCFALFACQAKTSSAAVSSSESPSLSESSAPVSRFLVFFMNADGTTLQSSEWDYGATPAYTGDTPTKKANAEYSFAFSGWSPEIVPVTKAAVYIAQYTQTINSYEITFQNSDGTPLESDTFAYGEIPAYGGEKPTLARTPEFTYTFQGWSPDIVPVTGKATYTAKYASTVNAYTVTFQNDDGTPLSSGLVNYGSTPVYEGETPTHPKDAQYTYTFQGWSPALAPVEEDITYTAAYTTVINSYTVTWANFDGTVLEKDYTVPYGTTVHYQGNTPTRSEDTGYTYAFSSWSPEVGVITGDTTYTAQYTTTAKKYTITFQNYDGTVLQTGLWDYGSTPVYSQSPATHPDDSSYTYSFNGWSPEIKTVEGNQTYIAEYSPSTLGLVYELSDEEDYYRVTDYTGSANSLIIGRTHLALPVTHISNYAFSNHDTITSVFLTNSITSIAIYAFQGCTSLTSFDVPENVECLSQGAFDGCTGLRNVSFGEEMRYIEKYAFYGDTALASVALPKYLLDIGEGVFHGCTSLTGITLPSSLCGIGSSAFFSTHLASIIIPANVVKMGRNVFDASNSAYLTDIYCRVSSRPEGWSIAWNSSAANIHWGVLE